MTAVVSSAIGAFIGTIGGWHFHRLYVRQMWRIERAARHHAQGRKS